MLQARYASCVLVLQITLVHITLAVFPSFDSPSVGSSSQPQMDVEEGAWDKAASTASEPYAPLMSTVATPFGRMRMTAYLRAQSPLL